MQRFQLLLSLLLVIVLFSCKDNSKEAIELVKKTKIQYQHMPVLETILHKLFDPIPSNATWNDFANQMASNNPTNKCEWSGKKVNGYYLIRLSNNDDCNYYWLADIDQGSVIYVNENDYLCRTYEISMIDQKSSFILELNNNDSIMQMENKDFSYLTRNGLLNRAIELEFAVENFEKPFFSNGLVCVLKGKVKNNTPTKWTNATLSGVCKIIYENKLIKKKCPSYQNFGFAEPINETNPWEPGTYRNFRLETYHIHTKYLKEENPAFVFLEVGVNAKNIRGDSYNQIIWEKDLMNCWNFFKK